MAQELSRQPLSAEACRRYHASPREVFGGQIGTVTSFFSEYFDCSPVSIVSTFRTYLHTALSRMIYTSGAWQPSKMQCTFGIRTALDGKYLQAVN
jgi:hypothetical protein